ncbi:alpha-(1,6)-fucosyltransferase-like [Penaeus japonicus]|uniref:alpha-(1,6)-fucosyltransferase-like n=1 Tax=Penaeus japonicus TaxID=27405 RepID=UPI001C7120C9|nr:alpha-(1,6)-fucosyltransferase-like [Penaeus japonicus]
MSSLKIQDLLCSTRNIWLLRLLLLFIFVFCCILLLLGNADLSASNERADKLSRLSYREKEPSKEMEQLLRQIGKDLQHTKQFISGQLQHLTREMDITDQMNTFLEDLNHYFRVNRHDLNLLRDSDGRGEWRRREAEDLSELIQHRLRVLQNPKDCDSAKKLYCAFTGANRGIGSQFHHLTICFMAAYATQRTLILNTDDWYNTSGGLNTFFLPLSNSCTQADLSQMVSWPGTDESLVVEVPKHDSLVPRPSYLPKSIPRDISERLVRLHGDPYAWWVGQFFKYAMRMNSGFEEYMRDLASELGYESPIVGIQVRRTDKMTNGLTFIPVKNFMDAVAEYYDDLEMRQEVKTRRVFVATDDPSVIKEAKERYPAYQFVYNKASVISADLSNRRTEENLRYYFLWMSIFSRGRTIWFAR